VRVSHPLRNVRDANGGDVDETVKTEPEGPPTFGALLRRYRVAANLSQEALAVRAGLSLPAVNALERGTRRAPRLETVRLLAAALHLSEREGSAFTAAAHRHLTAAIPPTPPHNLPTALTPLIGRERDVAAAVALLRPGQVRLVTLTGPPGVGKTRVGLDVAAKLLHHFADGVFVVALPSLREPRLLPAYVAQALGLDDASVQPAVEPLVSALRAHLKTKRMLLVLDNFEQVVAAAPLLTDLLEGCPHLAMLVTSRAPLRVRGEREMPVEPLALPPADALPVPDALARYPSVALFVQRAQAVRPSFALTSTNAPAVAAICTQLDGLPLAIELAAARVKLLRPQELLPRLERQLDVLRDGPRDLPARQRTLRDAIAWSYDLLDDSEQLLLRQLAVFVGDATLEAVSAVAGANGSDVVEGLAALVDQSLVQPREGAEGNTRVALLEAVRAYGLEQLVGRGELAAVRQRHAAYYVALAERATPEMAGQLQREHDNLVATVHWARASGEAAVGVRVARAQGDFWAEQGHDGWAANWYRQVLTLGQTAEAGVVGVADCLRGLALVLHTQGQDGLVVRLYAAAAARSEGAGTTWAGREDYSASPSGAAVRATLGEAGFAVAWAEGRLLSLADIAERVRCALG